MKKRKYIMVHTHTPVASFLGRIAGKLVHIPLIIYTAHGFHFHEYGCKIKNFIYYQLEKVAGRFTDVLITINEDDYRIAKENNILPNGRVIYIKGVGVNSEKFALKRIKEDRRHEILTKLSIDSEMFVISSTGRLAREKHFDQVIESLGYVNEKRLKFKFLIAGDGPLYYNLLETAKFYGIQDEVMFLGQIDQIPELLSISNIYVTTSSREGLPVSVMEAMAMEKPVIAYNIRGVRDLIKDGVNGFLVPFGDIEGFANKIIYLMENQEIAKEMGKRGREKIEKEFSLKVILKDMKKLYREILKEE